MSYGNSGTCSLVPISVRSHIPSCSCYGLKNPSPPEARSVNWGGGVVGNHNSPLFRLGHYRFLPRPVHPSPFGRKVLDVRAVYTLPSLKGEGRGVVAERLVCLPPILANRAARVTSGSSHLGIAPDDAAGRRVFFFWDPRFPRPCISVLLHSHFISPHRLSRPLQSHDGNTARFARCSNEELEERVSVARITTWTVLTLDARLPSPLKCEQPIGRLKSYPLRWRPFFRHSADQALGSTVWLTSENEDREGMRQVGLPGLLALAGSLPDFRMWESCRTMPLVAGVFFFFFFFRGSPFSPHPLLHSVAAPFSSRFTHVGSQGPDVQCCLNLYTPLLYKQERSPTIIKYAIILPFFPIAIAERDVRAKADRRERANAGVPRGHCTINTISYDYLLHKLRILRVRRLFMKVMPIILLDNASVFSRKKIKLQIGDPIWLYGKLVGTRAVARILFRVVFFIATPIKTEGPRVLPWENLDFKLKLSSSIVPNVFLLTHPVHSPGDQPHSSSLHTRSSYSRISLQSSLAAQNRPTVV
ncbi:hypothetical protein PR048_007859 [Dryococelus australis]|uniref:Uncharacterized protein n=1 Tax=Dryococelus australis TaxID=614101 RepID=A0ABQ9HWB1_9NEOP|nr:hypothetical protein PR048_007859 [Dryococelus australis]